MFYIAYSLYSILNRVYHISYIEYVCHLSKIIFTIIYRKYYILNIISYMICVYQI